MIRPAILGAPLAHPRLDASHDVLPPDAADSSGRPLRGLAAVVARQNLVIGQAIGP